MNNQDYKTADALDRRYAIAQAELNAQGKLKEIEVELLAALLAGEKITNEKKVEVLESFLSAKGLWLRKCDVTGEGMNEGYLLWDDFYVKNESDAISALRQNYSDEGRPDVAQRFKDSAVLELAYEEELYYYTEWEAFYEIREGNFYIELSTGKLIDYENYLSGFLK